MPTVSRLALPWGISLLSCSFLRDLQAAFYESLAHTSRHGLLGQASLALLFHTITLESRGTPRGTPLFSSACQISLKSAPKDRGHQGAISKATVFMDVLESGMGSFVVGRSQIWAFPTFLARPYLQKRIPTSPMQEAKQGAENFQPMRRQEGRSRLFLAVLRKRLGLYPVSSPHLSALCPLEGQGGTSVLVPTCPGLPCPLAWKAQSSSGLGSLHGLVETTLRHVKEVWSGQRKPVLWY